jgi:hypothetical protein
LPGLIRSLSIPAGMWLITVLPCSDFPQGRPPVDELPI